MLLIIVHSQASIWSEMSLDSYSNGMLSRAIGGSTPNDTVISNGTFTMVWPSDFTETSQGYDVPF